MVRPEELERLSRLLDGELPADEARALELELQRRPELASAHRRLKGLLTAAAALPDELPEGKAAALVAGALARARPRRPRLTRRAGWVAGALAIAAAVAFALLGGPAPLRLEPDGRVTLDGEPVTEQTAVRSEGVIATGPASAARVRLSEGEVVLGPNGRLRVGASGALELLSGAARVTDAQLSGAGAQLRAEGRAAVAVGEPGEAFARVTQGLEAWPMGEDDMRAMKRLQVPALAIASATMVACWVQSGEATVTPQDGPAARVVAGERWTSPQLGITAPRPAPRGEQEETRAPAPAAPAAPAVTGRVFEPDGRPAAGVAVVLYPVDGLPETVTTDREGRFTSPLPPAGLALVHAAREGKSASYVAEGRALGDVPLTLMASSGLKGTVRAPDGSPVKKVEVWLSPGRTPFALPGYGPMRTFNGAQFELTEVPAGEVQVHVISEGSAGMRAAHALVRVSPGAVESVSLQLAPADARVHGEVLDAVTRKPVERYQIQLLSADGSGEALYQPPSGTFAFGQRTPGPRQLLVRARGYKSERVQVTLERGKDVDAGAVLLQPLR